MSHNLAARVGGAAAPPGKTAHQFALNHQTGDWHLHRLEDTPEKKKLADYEDYADLNDILFEKHH